MNLRKKRKDYPVKRLNRLWSRRFLTTDEFLIIFENCYEWTETKLKRLISQYNFTRPQALYIIQCGDASMNPPDLKKFKEQMKEND